MKYKNIKQGIFISRPNRFIAEIEIDGKIEICHVKNTGRCRELLTENAVVYVDESDNKERKTRYDLISVYKGNELFNIDSAAPNKVVHEWINQSGYFKNVKTIKPECKYKKSRFDFYIETENRKIFAEVKGVTLEENGVLMFPDAPTERGVKHINELIECTKEGYECYIIFVVQTEKAKYFTPNRKTHKEFADALCLARQNGVNILCFSCNTTKDELTIKDEIEVYI